MHLEAPYSREGDAGVLCEHGDHDVCHDLELGLIRRGHVDKDVLGV